MRRLMLVGLAIVVVGSLVIAPATSGPTSQTTWEYVVLYEEGVSLRDARAAVKRLGGTIVKENAAVGLATVRSADSDFVLAAGARSELVGAAVNRPLGSLAPELTRKFSEERLDAERRASMGAGAETAADVEATGAGMFEPFAPLQWDMAMIHATRLESHDAQPGKAGVVVGIIDTGIDGSHPDIAPNFDAALSRNFTTDIELVDGPCADEPDASCSDPADVDENGHGTHVAGTVGAAVNNLGVGGVAPEVTLVNLRAGQDSGFFFLQPSVDALTYAGDNGVDVVNMSYYIDPWQFNCRDNPADSPEAQLEQRTIIEATNRALRYASKRGVTLVGAAGNANLDLGDPRFDATSPDFPPGSEYPREIDNSCLDLPTEGYKVLSVTALGPSTVKADYSNYGVEQAAVSAPGGYFRDYLGTSRHRTPENLVLSTYPESVARELGEIDEDGIPTTPFVLRDCQGEACAYYTYFQGTSMASPHAAGVAALIVSEYGKRDRKRGGYTLHPRRVEKILERTASDHACPEPRLFSYEDVGRPPEYDAFCEGSPRFNGFYGHGIVNALAAVGAG
ncbi:MAG TPA: S8 family serine peptidase [Gaiella sp.]|nr:S8 family serine peptidase [Gaiella sp.]